jgi:hypothetical protein
MHQHHTKKGERLIV